MEELKQELKLELNDVINGFSPSFTRILLERLKEEKNEVIRGIGMDKEFVITPFLGVILYQLRSQVFGDKTPYLRTKKGREMINLILDTIDATEEFLALFEAPEKEKLISGLDSGVREIPGEQIISEEDMRKFREEGIPNEIKGGFIPTNEAPEEHF